MLIFTSGQCRANNRFSLLASPVGSWLQLPRAGRSIPTFLLTLAVAWLALLTPNTVTAQTYTADFSTQPTIDKYGYAADWPWNSTVTVNLGGVDYLITNAINGSYTWNGSAIVYSTAGDASPLIKRKDGKPFKFYGVKLNYTNYKDPVYYTYPFLTVQYATTGSAQANELYDSDRSVTLAKAGGVAVTGVTLMFHGLNTLTLDDLIVGPDGTTPPPTAPTFTQTPTATAVCAGNTATFTATATGATSFQWQQANNASFNSPTTISSGGIYTVSTSGTTSTLSIATNASVNGYYFRAVATNSTGSTNSGSALLTVNARPTVSITALASAYCKDASAVTLTGNPAGGSFTIDGTAATQFNPAILATGNRSVVYTYTNGNGCSNTATQNVTINALPMVAITGLATAYCRDAAPLTLTGTPNGGSFTIDNLAATQFAPGTLAIGAHTVGFVYTDANGCTNSVTKSVTVNPLPILSITGLASAYCKDAPAVTLTATPTGGSFAIDGAAATSFTPANLAIGTRTVDYRYTDGNGCTNTATQQVTIKAVPNAPTLLTQSGQDYPGNQSAVNVDLNTGNVNLVVGGCAGTVNWSGSNNSSGTGTTISVPTSDLGTFIYQATCTVDGCTSPVTSATVNVSLRLRVLHRDVDNYADNNSVQPVLIAANDGKGAVPLSAITLRYYLTVENFMPLTNLFIYYAQVGAQNIKLRYVPLDQPRQGALGYVEYSFTPAAGNLASNSDSGPIQSYFAKSDYGGMNELDDYSYNPVRDQLLANLHITAYYNGVLVWGQEPSLITPVRKLRVLTESKNGPSATAITTNLLLRNEGNLPVNYADLRIRYYFTADNQQGLTFYSDFMGQGALQGQLVKINPPLAGADTYLEIRPTFTGQLMPLSQLGALWYSIYSPQGARFDQTNDYSYQEQPAEYSPNTRVVVYVGNERVWGVEPGASARIAASEEPGSALSVRVLGNPIEGDQIRVEITGAGGQPLRLLVSDLSGRVVSQQQVEAAMSVEQRSLNVSQAGAGLLLLQVSTPSQRQTLKVLKGL